MPLESLNNEQINIHDLSLEQEKKPMPEWQKHYEALKKSPFYDEENKEWNDTLFENQELKGSGRSTVTKLLGILFESQLNKETALESYNNLKNTPLYDRDAKQWNRYTTEDNLEINPYRIINDQLLNILIETQFDKLSAKKMYDELKESIFFDKQKKQWNQTIHKRQSVEFSDREAVAQLLGVLVESQFDKTSAKELYENLKKTELNDSKNNLWHWEMDKHQKLQDSKFNAPAQLLGVLVEVQFNKESAQKLFRKLKETNLYDKKRNQWNRYMDEKQELQDLDRNTSTQLLSILCEKELSEDGIINQTPPLPEERNY